jgi:actin related protein 2/3 complex subunit 2
MILLELRNRIIFDAVLNRLNTPQKDWSFLDAICADFDGVKFHIRITKESNVFSISINWKCIEVLLNNGGNDELTKVYGAALSRADPESGYGLTLHFDLDKAPANKEAFAENIAQVKRHLLSGPFKKVFKEVESGKGGGAVTTLAYRDDEAIYLKPEKDSVSVVFSVNFRDAGDQVLAKNFLQEYVNSRRGINNAPGISYSKETPGELAGVAGVEEKESQSFVTFVLFKAHINDKVADKTIGSVQNFRDYLHYHIKCSKAYMHTRMRARVDVLLQILNRARPADMLALKEKKTMSGKTFIRQSEKK